MDEKPKTQSMSFLRKWVFNKSIKGFRLAYDKPRSESFLLRAHESKAGRFLLVIKDVEGSK